VLPQRRPEVGGTTFKVTIDPTESAKAESGIDRGNVKSTSGTGGWVSKKRRKEPRQNYGNCGTYAARKRVGDGSTSAVGEVTCINQAIDLWLQ